MGMPTCSSIPVAASTFYPCSAKTIPSWMEPFVQAYMSKAEFEELMADRLYHPQNNPNPTYTAPQQFDINNSGWVFDWTTRDFNNNGMTVIAAVIHKDGREVFAVNSDQYAPEGEITMEFFADDETVLRDFINDTLPNSAMQIATNTTIHQWM